MCNRVIVTGGTGFIGGTVCRKLVEAGHKVVNLGRNKRLDVDNIVVDLADDISVARLDLTDIDVIVHSAARAHVMRERSGNPLEEYRKVNVKGTLQLAKKASESGVRRFVYVSSIKVNGEYTMQGESFRHTDIPRPTDEYGLSKYEAEEGLVNIAKSSNMELVIVRPTLVYGREVKGNFETMYKLIRAGIPLPLGAVHNQRSLIGVDNLADLLVTCAFHPHAVGQIFLASDGEDISTTRLLRELASAMNKPARLFPVPCELIAFMAKLVGKMEIARRLLSSLQVDTQHTREILEWSPPLTLQQGFKRYFNDQDV